MSERSNVFDLRIPFNDNLSHFMRMDKGLVEEYFGKSGPLARVDAIPNWVEATEDGYELVTLDSSNEVFHRWGIYIQLKRKPITSYEQGKGKAVATWDYVISVPGADEDFAYQVYSNDGLKYVFAYPGGQVAAIPPRMRQMQNQIATLKFRTKSGTLSLMPYVNLAFFMWLEENVEEGYPTFTWLIENMEGWRDSYQA